MKFTCTKEHLQRALKTVSGIAGRNPALPILRHVLLRVERGKLRISATDLEVGVTTWVTGKAEADGVTTIPLKQLAEYVGNLPHNHIHLSLQNGTLEIVCGPARASFQGETAENFPLIPTLEKGLQFSLSAPHLTQGLDAVMYASGVDDTRPELSGVLLTGKGGSLTLAATDSYRLAESHIDVPDLPKEGFRIILPIRAAQELRRALEGEESVRITISESQVLAETPSTHLISRLIDGHYPDYAQIIPQESSVTISLSRQDLLRAIRAASVFTQGEANNILLETTPTALRVTATAQELGETVMEVPAEIHGGTTTIHFNHRFLIDALVALSQERVRLQLTSASVPAVFHPEGSHQGTLALVMPIKL